jgi:hypothetical protein
MAEAIPTTVEDAADVLLAFLRTGGLTKTIASLEHSLEGKDGDASRSVVSEAGITVDLLAATMAVRAELGRMSDLIHAAGIVLALPHILEPGERVKGRPSLAAGNDPTRPFDLETDRRVAEFKLSKWMGGSNAMRKRQTFKDLVGLTLDTSDRRKELYVLGPKPATFLRGSKSAASWALDRSAESLKARFVESFGSLDMPVSVFTSTHGKDVAIVDLAVELPNIFGPIATMQVASDDDVNEP